MKLRRLSPELRGAESSAQIAESHLRQVPAGRSSRSACDVSLRASGCSRASLLKASAASAV